METAEYRPTIGGSEMLAKGWAGEVKRIIVPLDFSAESLHELPYALTLARLSGGKIVLLCAVEPFLFGLDLKYLESGPVEEITRELEEYARRMIDTELLERVIVRDGFPPQVIVDVAKELGADLIIVAPHGHRGIKHFVTGGTVANVLRRAPCAVLVVGNSKFFDSRNLHGGFSLSARNRSSQGSHSGLHSR
jgi:nucleotide-binding universal stress UspA family protein